MEKELLNNFNDTTFMFMDFLNTIKEEKNFNFYKLFSQKIVKLEPTKLIEQYILYCLPYYQHIITKNEHFFLKNDFEYDKNNDIKEYENLFNVVKIKTIFNCCDADTKNFIFEYLILLSNYAKDYFNLKYS